MLLSSFLASARNDLEFGIQRPGGEHDIDVRGVSGGGGNQSRRMLDAGFAKRLLVGSVPDDREPFADILQAVLVVFDDHEWNGLFFELISDTAPYPACPADDVVP